MAITIDRVHDIPVKDLRHEYAHPVRGRPVIITGCVDHWPARQKWDLDYFEKKYDNKRVKFSGREWTVGEFVRDLRSGKKPRPYLNQVKLDEQFPELYEDIADLKYTRKNFLNSPLLPRAMRITRGIKAVFIGGEGSGFGMLHWDFSYLHVYISQIRGGKDFLVYAPSDTPYLYQVPGDCRSVIEDFNDFDIEEFPEVKKATPIRFSVKEGETLFIPGGWWHATQMRELSISIAESALDGGNWKIRSDFYKDEFKERGLPLARRLALGAYMKALGPFVP
jgi:histone arginine demethylase JMJD6